jgi:hypothetical protein
VRAARLRPRPACSLRVSEAFSLCQDTTLAGTNHVEGAGLTWQRGVDVNVTDLLGCLGSFAALDQSFWAIFGGIRRERAQHQAGKGGRGFLDRQDGALPPDAVPGPPPCPRGEKVAAASWLGLVLLSDQYS